MKECESITSNEIDKKKVCNSVLHYYYDKMIEAKKEYEEDLGIPRVYVRIHPDSEITKNNKPSGEKMDVNTRSYDGLLTFLKNNAQ